MIVIGTSGYHFPDWEGQFYPSGMAKSEWLGYYARAFPAVEINMTYYGVPKLESVARWVDATPDSFAFFVKVPGDVTHKRENEADAIRELLTSLAPMIEAKKLQGLLAQFPASFRHAEEHLSYLLKVRDLCAPHDLFVEFRHKSWDRDDMIPFCRDQNLSWVTVDQPALPGLSRPRPAATGTAGYVRFHGRNRATWYHPERGDRYDWDYSEKELSQWIPRLRALAQAAETSYLFFNNCHAGQAIRSARLMKRILQTEFEVL